MNVEKGIHATASLGEGGPILKEGLQPNRKLMSAADAVRRFVSDGALVGMGGQSIGRSAMCIYHEMIRQRKKNLTLVGCNLSIPMDMMVGLGLVRRTECGTGNLERFGGELLEGMERVIDTQIISGYIEMTRFPVPEDAEYQDSKSFGGLVRAAECIGQIGDPGYLRKAPALFHELMERGDSAELGFEKPGDLRNSYARLYWDVVSPYVQDALGYLRATQEGKQWLASLYANVFAVEHSAIA